MIRIGIADDQDLVRAGFSMVLESQEDMVVVWGAADGEEAYQRAIKDPVDVIVMDVQMPKLNGIAATEKIVYRCPDTRVIMLTTFDIQDYILESISAGASGFLLKDTSPEELLHAIRTIDESSAIISPKATVQLLKYIRGRSNKEQGYYADSRKAFDFSKESNDADPLTQREEEVLVLMAQGYSNQEIADILFVALSTVKSHVRKILTKTQSRDRVQAVVFAYQHGIVD